MTMIRDRTINNKLNPAVPTFFAYDDAGGQQISQAAAGTKMTFDTVVIQTQNFQFNASQDRLQLNTNSSGWFMVMFDCSLAAYTDPISDVLGYFCIYKNDSFMQGSQTYFSVDYDSSNQISYYQYAGIKMPVYLEDGDYIHIKGRSLAGIGLTIADTMRLTVSFIPMKGWDNSQAGRIEYKGGVDR